MEMPRIERNPGKPDDLGMVFDERLPERPHLVPGGDILIPVVLEEYSGFYPEGALVGSDQGVHSCGDVSVGVLPAAGVDLDDGGGSAQEVTDLKEHISKRDHPLRIVPPQVRLHLPAMGIPPTGYTRFGVQGVPRQAGDVRLLLVELFDRRAGEHRADILTGPLDLGLVLDEVARDLNIRAPERFSEAPALQEPSPPGHLRDVWVDVVCTEHGNQTTPWWGW